MAIQNFNCFFRESENIIQLLERERKRFRSYPSSPSAPFYKFLLPGEPMRIRKNSKISALEISTPPSESSNILICKLNQSPWDAIFFPPPPPPLDSSPYFQVDGDDGFTGNGSLGDSFGAMESFEYMKLSLDEEDNSSDMYGNKGRKNEVIYCNKTFGEGNWECCREAKQGSSFCEFHLAHSTSKKPDNPAKNPPTRRAKKAKKSESNPDEIYYYSGFEPRWGKKRGAEKSDEPGKVGTEAVPEVVTSAPSSSNSSNIGNEIFLHFDEEDDDDDEEEDAEMGTKRPRRPIKARSLKSLM